MLGEEAYADLDARLAPVDEELGRRYPGEPHTRQPVHTLYVPADLFGPGVLREYGRLVRRTVAEHGPLPFDEEITARVLEKLAREPVEDLRIDFEDGYGIRDDAEEDAAARATATAVREGERPAFVGLRCKSLEPPTRRRAVRTLDVFLDALGPPPPGFVITLPKVSAPAQVEAMVVLCGRLESAHGLDEGTLRFEVQIETPPAVLGADGTATVARLITAAAGRCTALHYGTYDYSAAVGIAAEYQSLDHPAADHAKAVQQVAAALAAVDALFVVHAEDPAHVTGAMASRRYADFVASRPATAELAAVDVVLALAAATGRRLHVLHLSAATVLPRLARAKEAGLPVTAETCPHYLTLTAEEVPDGAKEFKCCPPIRDGANRELLWRGLASGTIDCVVSDHSPCPPELKMRDSGDFGAAWGGVSSLQLGLSVMWTSARVRGYALADVVRWMCRRPADLARLRLFGEPT